MLHLILLFQSEWFRASLESEYGILHPGMVSGHALIVREGGREQGEGGEGGGEGGRENREGEPSAIYMTSHALV